MTDNTEVSQRAREAAALYYEKRGLHGSAMDIRSGKRDSGYPAILETMVEVTTQPVSEPSNELVAKLRERDRNWQENVDRWVALAQERGVPFDEATEATMRDTPDRQAADRIDALEGALEAIREASNLRDYSAVGALARRALEPKQ